MEGMVQLKRYRSHKTVCALKIAKIEVCVRDSPPSEMSCVTAVSDEATTTLTFEDGQALTVSPAYVNKHQPAVGGYFVSYADGYESWSPAKAFEEGYTEVKAETGSQGSDPAKLPFDNLDAR